MEDIIQTAKGGIVLNREGRSYNVRKGNRVPPIEEGLSAEDLEDIDPEFLGQQGYRLWFLSCKDCIARGV